MPTLFHPANERGHADHGWLKSHHSFSFANYYNPKKMGFGALRVLNDDWVAPGQGFGRHGHRDMEIISIPLSGSLKHEDSMGHSSVIRKGEVQVMSAGRGIEHSEFNNSSDAPVAFLQIWVHPRKANLMPRYDQREIDLVPGAGFQQIVGPEGATEGLWVQQDTWFHLGIFEEGETAIQKVARKENGVYAFMVEGSAEIDGKVLQKRDALGLWDMAEISIKALEEQTQILLIEVPM